MTIATIPTTNLRIVVSLALAALYVLALIAAMLLNREISETAATAAGVFIGGMMGLDFAQFAVKRNTDFRALEARARVSQSQPAVTPVEPDAGAP